MASQQVFSDLDISGKAKSSAQGIFMGAVSSLPSASALSGGVVFNTPIPNITSPMGLHGP